MYADCTSGVLVNGAGGAARWSRTTGRIFRYLSIIDRDTVLARNMNGAYGDIRGDGNSKKSWE